MNLRYVLVAAVVASTLLPAVTAWALPGTVRLKNGGWIEGEILEMLPGEHVSVRLADGAARTIPWAEVERVEQGQAAAAQAAPAGAAPAVTAPETPSEPAAPAKTVLALDDPNTHTIVLVSGDTKIYFLGLPRSDASSVALRFERYVHQPELADCKELAVTVDGVESRYPLQHKAVVNGIGFRETVQAQATLGLIEQMANAKDVRFDLCTKSRPLSFVSHHAPIVRFVAEFKSLIGKPPLAQAPARIEHARDYELAQSGYGYSGESLSELEQERAKIGIGGPIALTVAGGVVALSGGTLLITGLLLNDLEDNCAPDELYCDDGGALKDDIATTYTTIGVVGLVLGGVGLAIGLPTLVSRIKARRELGVRIKELRGNGRSLQPMLTVHF